MIAGDAAGGRLAGPVEGLAVAPKFLDVTLPEDATFREAVPRGHTAFAYVDQGEVRFGPQRTAARAPALVIFGDGDLVEAAGAPGGGRFLLAAARPLGEPIARHTAVRTGGRCDAFVVAHDTAGVAEVVADCRAVGWPQEDEVRIITVAWPTSRA